MATVQVPAFVIQGDCDHCLNYELTDSALDEFPEGSEHVVIEGDAHTILLEKPYHRELQESIATYLAEALAGPF